MVNQELLQILVCPENKTPLHEADAELVQRINASISAGEVRNRVGEQVEDLIDEGLIREDNAWLYPVRNDIPVMLIDEAISLASFSG